MCEKTDGPQFSHYTYDHSVYKFTVEPTYDTEKGEINCRVTYRKGTVDPKGEWTADANTAEETFTDDSTPTFTNTYSTSLPLSGMSGVTLTYLPARRCLCAAGWPGCTFVARRMRREVSVVNKKVCSFPILFALALLIGTRAVVFPASAQSCRPRPAPHHGERHRGAQLRRLPDL